MLHLSQHLPPDALIGGENRALTQALLRTGGARFIARDTDVVRDGDRVSGWREAAGATIAVTTKPNVGYSRFAPGAPAAMLCETGLNCGFMLPDFAPVVERFTAAVIYSSQGDAKTLLSVSTGQSNNLIFLSETDGSLGARDRQSGLGVTLGLPGDLARPRLAVFCFTGRALVLRMGGRSARAEGAVPSMAHPGDFFIGCRSNRTGLAKTLGSSRLHEVVFWPDRALLGSADADDIAALAALETYHRWTF